MAHWVEENSINTYRADGFFTFVQEQDLVMEVSAAETCIATRRKRILGRFRATLAGLLELEVLRVRQKEMVEAALEQQESPDHTDDLLTFQQGPYQYWVEESSFRLKLKRSVSHENLTDIRNPRTLVDLRRSGVHNSSEELQDLHRHECEGRQSRVSSGFCESHNDAMSSLSTSLASLSHQNPESSADFRQEHGTNSTRRFCLSKTQQEHVRKGDTTTQGFSQLVIPEAGFLSVLDLYPDSHWPEISNILQPQVVLEPSYRSDLRSRHGSEVYRYPSPLHAVALQSPLYAPQSPEHRRNNARCSPGTFLSKTSSLPRSDSVHGQRRSFECTPSCPDSPSSMKSLTSPSRTENLKEIVLKRARGEMWKQTMSECSGIISWSRRSLASLQHTCTMGKNGTSSAFKSVNFQSRATESTESGPPRSSLVPSPGFRGRLGTHKNRVRRHTAALTNLNIFAELNRTSAETSVLHHQRSSEVFQEKFS